MTSRKTGIQCPRCGSNRLRVNGTRRLPGYITRYRTCSGCWSTTTTVERAIHTSPQGADLERAAAAVDSLIKALGLGDRFRRLPPNPDLDPAG